METMELVAFYNNIIENTPEFFDLENGPIYNLDANEIDYGTDTHISNIRVRKTLLLYYRDVYARLFQRTCLLISDNYEGE